MRRTSLGVQFVVGMTCLAVGTVCEATTFTASFDDLTATTTVTGLDNYTNNGLSVTTASSAWGSDPPQWYIPLNPFYPNATDGAFYAMANASDTWVTIQTVDSSRMYSASFMYGNTWTTGNIFGPNPWGNPAAVLQWETFRNGTMVSSGDMPSLAMGTVVHFSDLGGFD